MGLRDRLLRMLDGCATQEDVHELRKAFQRACTEEIDVTAERAVANRTEPFPNSVLSLRQHAEAVESALHEAAANEKRYQLHVRMDRALQIKLSKEKL